MTARMLGPAGRGAYTAALVFGVLGSQFGNLGMHSANTYYVGRDRNLFPQLLSNSLCIASVVGGFIALVLWIFFTFRSAWAPVHGELLAIALFLIPATLAQLLLQNLLIGIQNVKWYNIIDITARVTFVIVLGVAWLMLHGIRAEQVALFSLLATTVTGCIAGYRNLKIAGRLPKPSFALFREQTKYGLRSYITCLAAYAVLKSDILLVKYLSGDSATGLYSLASSMTDFIYTFPAVVGMILFPMLTGTGDLQARWRRARKTMLGVTGIMSGIAACAAVVAKPVTGFAFGHQFLPAVPAFLVLCVAIVFYGANNVISIFFSSCGQPWISVWVWPVAAVLNIGFNLIAIPRWGIVGAAISSLFTYALLFFVQYLFATRFVKSGAEHETA